MSNKIDLWFVGTVESVPVKAQRGTFETYKEASEWMTRMALLWAEEIVEFWNPVYGTIGFYKAVGGVVRRVEG